jgi:signal transduction histidine kinase
MAARSFRSISTPIIWASIAVALTIAMLVGWIILMVQKMSVTQELVQNTSLLIAGIISFVLITVVLIMFSVFLTRHILEVRRQTTFIDSVTHELKSPLASLRLCLETLARPDIVEAQRLTLRRMMFDDVERLSTFIDDVLESSRLGHGMRPQVLDDIQLASLTREIAEMLGKRYKLQAADIVVSIPETLVVRTDRTALETVLKNLVDNAVKYSDPPVRVAVTAVSQGRSVEIQVRDSGIGIGEADLKRIFERFYRVPIEAVRARRGTGLGLFVVQSLVRMLGGRLAAKSAGTGQGTTMIVTLPVDVKDE